MGLTSGLIMPQFQPMTAKGGLIVRDWRLYLNSIEEALLGTPVASANGGTGINNGSSTIILGGNLRFSGAFSTTFTVTGITNLTLPTAGTLLTTTGDGSNLTFGTGKLVLGGNLTLSGAFPTIFTVTAATNLTLPTAGTVLTDLTAANLVVATLQLTGNQLAGLQTTPRTIVAGIVGKLLVPIFFSIVAAKASGLGWTNGNTGFFLAYESNKGTSLIASGGSVGLALGNGGTIHSFAHVPANVMNTAGLTLSGKGLQLVTLLDITSGTGGTTTINVVVVYSVQDPALF